MKNRQEILDRIESYKKEIKVLEDEEIGYTDNTISKERIEQLIWELEWILN